MRTLRDRVAVVTGAASGIGRATAIGLAKQGCNLAISDVNTDGLEQTAAEVRRTGRRVLVSEVDVSDRARMQRYVDEVIEEFGAVHIVINNAGVTVAAPFDEHSIEDFEWLIGINFWGVVYGCKFFLPHLKAADEGHIVNISSVFGIIGMPNQTSYCASKFAVRGFTESLQIELKEHNIGVTSVHPGGVDTRIAKDSRGHQDLKDAASTILAKGVTPEHAAGRIIEAIKDNRMRQLITREAYIADFLKRVAPSAAQKLLARTAERMEKNAKMV